MDSRQGRWRDRGEVIKHNHQPLRCCNHLTISQDHVTHIEKTFANWKIMSTPLVDIHQLTWYTSVRSTPGYGDEPYVAISQSRMPKAHTSDLVVNLL